MKRILTRQLHENIGKEATLVGWLHWRRNLGGIQFALIRDKSGVVQVVLPGGIPLPLAESVIRVSGTVVENAKAPGGVEVAAQTFSVISEATKATPIEIPKEEWRANPETLLEYRYISLRGPKARAPLEVQAALVRGFRRFLDDAGFCEIFTPKLVKAGAEGGSNLFPLRYFDQPAFLAQSPQLYKQIMVGVFERVYETAPVWRAEEHNTSRHLNEYLSLDVEMGFIESEEDVMQLQEGLVAAMLEEAGQHAGRALELLDVTLPKMPGEIPRIPHVEARRIVREEMGVPSGNDFNDEAERALGSYVQERYSSDWVFITAYPKSARPFYTYPEADGSTRGYDLLFRGLEITSGGQRIHDHAMLEQSLHDHHLDKERFRDYLEVFKFGMPPHGGFAIGAERFTQQMLGLPNVRYARAFPRDRHRLTP